MSSRAGYLKKNKVGVCCMCRKVFQAARSDKKTCSDKCRKAWQRYNEAAKRDSDLLKVEASQIDRLNALINRSVNNAFRVR